ncbi:hypothetical protein CWI80_04300 [Pseudidiomarina sediminum]|uniref:YjbF family lipoprotein n=1 Tax=Pseudidiomarina sediminum TaxID=431675 RepID=A0A432Z9J7_9GAMM|nr:YjbF family lipoprotein [Pseudidiomarina sediminum]RUO74569.1 hypothetical protein CWI80_04300 [Pseudidiomarina sediminum]
MATLFRMGLVVTFSALLLSGCSARVKNVADTAKTALFGHQDVVLTTEQVNDYPYAAAYIKTDHFPQAVAVLDRVSDQQRVYRTGAEESITVRLGRILTSSGVPGMPLYTSNWQSDPLACHVQQQHMGTRQLCPRHWQRDVEVGNYGENDVTRQTVQSSFMVGEKQSYQHPDGTDLTVTTIIERGSVADHSFENQFYTVAGRVVYARQWVSPKIGYAIWREMKPFSGDLN